MNALLNLIGTGLAYLFAGIIVIVIGTILYFAVLYGLSGILIYATSK